MYTEYQRTTAICFSSFTNSADAWYTCQHHGYLHYGCINYILILRLSRNLKSLGLLGVLIYMASAYIGDA